MSIRYQYFDSDSGDRIYNSAFFARHLQTVAGDGYVYGEEDELEVTEHSPQEMSVDVGLGKSWVQGRMFEIYSATENVAITAADPSNDRIDRIVVRLDLPNRLIKLDVIDGTPAASPIPPSLTRDSNTWEISLAQISVTAGATEITNSDITDERDDDTVCGVSLHSSFPYVEGLIDFVKIKPYVKCILTSSYSFTTGNSPELPWDDTEYDNYNMWDSGNATRVTIQRGGIYNISATIDFDNPGSDHSDEYRAWLKINGSRQEAAAQFSAFGDSNLSVNTPHVPYINLSTNEVLSEGDYIEIEVYQETPFESTSYVQDEHTVLTVVWLGELS